MKNTIFKHIACLMASILTFIVFPSSSFAQTFPTKNIYINGTNCQAYYGANRTDIQNTQFGAWNFNLNSPVWVTCPVSVEPLVFQNVTGDVIEYWVNVKHNSPVANTSTCYFNVMDSTAQILASGMGEIVLGNGIADWISLGSYTIDDTFDYYESATISCYLAPNAYILGVEAYYYVP